MKTNRLTLSLIFILFASAINAQNFEVPKNYVLKDASDYAKYEKDIIACTNWLENTPLNDYQHKRIEANSFLLQWLTGSPTVTINMNADIVVKCTNKNTDLFMLFLAGWTRYSLENNYSQDQQKGYYEGFKSMINVYNKGILIKKDKDMDKLIAIYNKGELESWIRENIK